MRPVLANLCSYESLVNGLLDIEDIFVMNDALDVKYENERLYTEAMKD